MEKNAFIQLDNVTKEYPGVVALNKVSFTITPNDIHALVGENGAGKSTIIKILGGLERPSSGTLRVRGKDYKYLTPKLSQELGIAVIHQELMILPELSVAENLFLGQVPRFVNWSSVYERAQTILRRLGLDDINPKQPAGELTVAQQQMIEIARAVSRNASLLILDEPTSSLTAVETEVLLRLLESLRDEGTSIIYVSHRMKEVFDICNTITVLRDGNMITSKSKDDISSGEVIQLMVGRPVENFYVRNQPARHGEELLAVRDLTRRGYFYNVSFSLRAGEILGFSGLIGSGRTEVMRAVVGLDKYTSGEVVFNGSTWDKPTVARSINEGLIYLPEDRKSEGMFTKLDIIDNICSILLREVSSVGVISRKKTRNLSENIVETYSLRLGGLKTKGGQLSGGTQQKIILARALALRPKVLILDEPTRGIDVGAKQEIYRLLNQLTEMGTGIILISSELPEVLGLSDRIVVMREGYVVGELERNQATEQSVMDLAIGYAV
ncbi:sugar ABC transporter ATP-binding protein [Alicyclobacillus kakegawensis]|uniref:sugar ABC transporter ATP-binding protein n=1 Tax=Alicyclobacillus kakegawensis TaxID=392012 RepID=UPI00146FEBD1|nr:sugar ABC transporter ATP-binding protein [Alicyclobacillus kakegawensis]